MTTVRQYLHRCRKAELQAIHQFWFPGESALSARDELEERLVGALTSGLRISERVARLTRAQRSLLSRVLADESKAIESESLRHQLELEGIPGLEAENALRMLAERGFLLRARPPSGGRKAETVQVPKELARHLGEVLDVGRLSVQPADQISQKRLPFEIDFDGKGLEERISSLTDPDLGRLVSIAVGNFGIAEFGTPGAAELLESGARDGELQPAWRAALEEQGIGTFGPVTLKDFGIQVREPALIIFQEWIQKHAHSRLDRVDEPDTVAEAGVDLFIDLDELAARLDEKAIRLTRDGRIPKRFYEALQGYLYLPRLSQHMEGDVAEWVVSLGLRLGIVECLPHELQVHEERLRVWRKMDVTRRAEILMQLFLDESRGGRWSFHQESLRKILLDQLRGIDSSGWISLDAIIGVVVSTYLLELEEREVRQTLRQRREEDFARERLSSPFHRLSGDLIYWIVNRFLPLGLGELGLIKGRLSALRLTPLGREVLGMARRSDPSRILVNPNFEIILFCEDLSGLRLEMQLARFGERLSAERVRRYRVTRETLRDGVRSGLSLEEIRDALARFSPHPLPEPVLAAIRDWGKDLDWILAQPALFFRGLRPERSRALSELLTREGWNHVVSDEGIVVTEKPAGRRPKSGWDALIDRLREEGWLVREDRPEPARDDLSRSTA